MADWIEIGSASLSATIDPLGAELVSLRDAGGRELMTDADPAFWRGHAPLLFPVVGRLNGDVLRLDGAEYPMQQHGFARRSTFALLDASATSACFRLEDDAATHAMFPRAFRLDVTYAVAGSTLTLTVQIENREAERSLPASFGFHPAFAWPLPYGLPREDHRIVFATEEGDTIRKLTASLVDPAPRTSPLDRQILSLTDALFADDALVWDQVRSQSVRYGASTGPQLRVDFPDTPMLGVWTKPGAAFVCIEPWHGLADPVGFTGYLQDKPGIFIVPPGEARHIAMQVTLEA